MKKYSYHKNEVCLYLVATPIGNLEDITLRALNILKKVDYIYCEDTRNSKVLLNHYQIKTPLISYHDHNEEFRSVDIINHLKNNKNIAIISDAGFPLISDPGYVVVKKCIEENISVTTIPGPNAALCALVSSGLNCTSFLFYGFLDSKKTQKIKELENLKENTSTLIFYEAPHRILDTLNVMLEVLGNRQISISRELTKLYEEHIRGTIEEVICDLKDNCKGEMVIIVEGFLKEKLDLDYLVDLVRKEVIDNNKLNDACRNIANSYDVSKNVLYSKYLEKYK